MNSDKRKLQTLIKTLGTVLEENIVVACTSCNEVFLNMKYKDYMKLLNGDLKTPTKWYNKVVLHFCENPQHEILSNQSPSGINQVFNFTQNLRGQLTQLGISRGELYS
jgi:hypothetical protein